MALFLEHQHNKHTGVCVHDIAPHFQHKTLYLVQTLTELLSLIRTSVPLPDPQLRYFGYELTIYENRASV